jgi:hypothetical protein
MFSLVDIYRRFGMCYLQNCGKYLPSHPGRQTSSINRLFYNAVSTATDIKLRKRRGHDTNGVQVPIWKEAVLAYFDTLTGMRQVTETSVSVTGSLESPLYGLERYSQYPLGEIIIEIRTLLVDGVFTFFIKGHTYYEINIDPFSFYDEFRYILTLTTVQCHWF